MDPITVFQIVGTVVSLGDVVIKSINRLSALKAQFHNAPIIVTSMIGQLHMVKIAQDQLSPLNSPNFDQDPRYHELADQIGNALDSFGPILLALSQQLDQYESISADRVSVRNRMGFLYDEREMTNLSILLDRQVNALNLLLQAIQCRTWMQQSDIITRSKSQTILQLAQDCSSSLVGLHDVASLVSEGTTALSTRFEFDEVLRSTSLYQTAERSVLRRAIHLGRAIRATKPRYHETASVKGSIRGLEPKQVLGAMVSTAGDTQQVIGNNLNRGNSVKLSKDNNTSGESLDQGSSSRGKKSNSRETDSNEETEQPSPSLLSKADSGSPRSPVGWAIWRKRPQPQIKRPQPQIKRPQPKSSKSGDAEHSKVNKVLLLGASGGGKTTLFNALRLFTDAKYFHDHESSLRELVWENVSKSVRIVLRQAEGLGMDLEKVGGAEEHILFCPDCKGDPASNPEHANELARMIASLHFNEEFGSAIKLTDIRQSHDNAEYYINNIDRLAKEAAHRLRPTGEDILRTYVRTTGIHQMVLNYNREQFCFYDAGGMGSERRKWIHVYEDTSVVIFPIDTTSYTKNVREYDKTDNQMLEQLKLFESLVNSHWLAKAYFLVVFTKLDLLESCMKEVDINIFLRDSGIVPSGSPSGLDAYEYLGHLEQHIKGLDNSSGDRARTFVLLANLVDVENHNPAVDVFEMLESLTQHRRTSTFGIQIDRRSEEGLLGTPVSASRSAEQLGSAHSNLDILQPQVVASEGSSRSEPTSHDTDALSSGYRRLNIGNPRGLEGGGSSEKRPVSYESVEALSENGSLGIERPRRGDNEEAERPLRFDLSAEVMPSSLL